MVGQSLYISGQLGLPGTGATPAAMDLQARQAMDGVGAVLKAAGLGFEHLVKCNVYLANMDDYAAMNAAYASYFTERVPARTTVQAVALPSNAGIEVSCIAYADLAGITVVHPPAGSLPTPLGPYSPAVWAGDTLYLSGMGGQDPATKTVSDAVEGQVTQTVVNVATTLKAAGLSLGDAVAVQAYATRGDEATPSRHRSPTHSAGRRDCLRVAWWCCRAAGPDSRGADVRGGEAGGGQTYRHEQMNDVSAESTQVGPVLYAAPRPGATGDDVTTQARAAFRALQQSVKMAGFDWRDVAVVHVYLTDIADLPRANMVFAELFPSASAGACHHSGAAAGQGTHSLGTGGREVAKARRLRPADYGLPPTAYGLGLRAYEGRRPEGPRIQVKTFAGQGRRPKAQGPNRADS